MIHTLPVEETFEDLQKKKQLYLERLISSNKRLLEYFQHLEKDPLAGIVIL